MLDVVFLEMNLEMNDSQPHGNNTKPRTKKVIHSVVFGLLIVIFFAIVIIIVTILRHTTFDWNAFEWDNIFAIIILCGILAGLYFVILRYEKSKL
jgi:hypothetical protein